MRKLGFLYSNSVKPIRFTFIIFIIFLIFIITLNTVLAQSDSDELDWSWISFIITLIILIIVIILWIATYFIQRGIINRLKAESDKLKRYESRKDADFESKYQESERTRKREARAPKGNCLVCNRKFIPGADAYQCECGKFMHVHCLAEMELCPHCGRNIEKDTGVVRLEDSGSLAGRGAGRTKIKRLIKAKLCPVCNKIIKAGDSGMECDRCQTVMHEKCSAKTRKCPKCGN